MTQSFHIKSRMFDAHSDHRFVKDVIGCPSSSFACGFKFGLDVRSHPFQTVVLVLAYHVTMLQYALAAEEDMPIPIGIPILSLMSLCESRNGQLRCFAWADELDN